MAGFVRANEKDRVLMYEPATYGPRDKSTHSSFFGGTSSDFAGKKAIVSTDILCPMYPKVFCKLRLFYFIFIMILCIRIVIWEFIGGRLCCDSKQKSRSTCDTL